MSLPNVIINFKQTGAIAIQKGESGIVALILDGENQEVSELNNIKDARQSYFMQPQQNILQGLLVY